MSKEIWKNISSYSGLYQVSNKGRVKSLDRIVKYKSGVDHLHKGRIKKQPTNCKTKYRVAVLSKNNKISAYKISRLVATSFIKNNGKLPCVNHIDGNKKNDMVDNLEWCTYSKNSIHAFNNGLTKNTNKNRGLSWDKNRNKWIVHLYRNNKNIFIGRYNNKNKAISMLNNAKNNHDKN